MNYDSTIEVIIGKYSKFPGKSIKPELVVENCCFKINEVNLSEIWNLLEFFSENEVDYSISAYNVLFDFDICKKLNDFGCRQVQLSLDGLRRTHDKFHGNGSYNKIWDNIGFLNKYGIRTDIFTQVSKINISQIPWIMDESVRNSVDSFHFSTFYQSGDINFLDYKNMLEKVWLKCREYKYSSTKFSIKQNILSLLNYQNEINADYECFNSERGFDSFR